MFVGYENGHLVSPKFGVCIAKLIHREGLPLE